MHFCAGDLLIARQCQSLHEDIEAVCVRQALAAAEREYIHRSGRQKGTNPFCKLSNNYCNMKIIAVEAMQLFHETNMSYTLI